MVIDLNQYHSNIVLFFAELISSLVGTLFSALQVIPDLFASLRTVHLFQWMRYLRSGKWVYIIGSIILLISLLLNAVLYFDLRKSNTTVISHPPVRGKTVSPSPLTVLPSPSQQGNTPPATNSPSSRVFNENKLINCTVNCNGDVILSVNYISTDALSVYNQTWDLTITNGNLKPCSLGFTRLALQDTSTNYYFEGRSPVTNSGVPWNLGAVSGRGMINEDPYFSNAQPTGTFILSATLSISCQDGVSFLSEQYQSDKITL